MVCNTATEGRAGDSLGKSGRFMEEVTFDLSPDLVVCWADTGQG